MIGAIDAKRAELGAVQNRFASTIRNQANIQENLSAARSRIKDADFASETAALTKAQILQQASSTILTQSNQRPQSALSLLQG
jgi:flagellin